MMFAINWFSASIFGLIIVYFVSQLLFRPKTKKCKEFPRLRGWPLLGNTIHGVKRKWDVPNVTPNAYTLQCVLGFNQIFQKELGFYVEFGPTRLSLMTKAKSIEQVLKSNVLIDKPYAYSYLAPWLGTGLITSSTATWRKHRKLLTPTFHFKILDQFQPIIFEKSEIMIQSLSKHVDGEAVDIEPFVSMCTMDVICETAMGYNANAQLQSNNSFILAMQELGRISFQRMVDIFIMTDFIFKLTSMGRAYYKARDFVHDFIKNLIKEKKEAFIANPSTMDTQEDFGSKKPKAFMDLCILQHMQDKTFTEKDVLDEVNTFMFAGQDTTAVGTTWALFLLGHYPEVQTKLANELFEVLGDDCSRPITIEDLKHMKYLECVVKEAQRIYPSIPFIGREVPEDMEIEGMKIKKGTICGAFMTALHQDPEVFPEPLQFIPERFFPENAKGRNPFAYVPFSAGPRNCIGQRFALLEEKTFIANLIRNYEIHSVDHRDKIPISSELVSRPTKPIRMTFKRRLCT